jgi:hypothetical protein
MKSPRFAPFPCSPTTVAIVIAIAIVIVIFMQFSENLHSQSFTMMTSEVKVVPLLTREQGSQSLQLNHNMQNEVEILASIVTPDKIIINKTDFEFCSKLENNIVLPRNAAPRMSITNDVNRPFSWTTKAMTTHHHGINKTTCASSDDMLRAIQFGSRRWDDLGLANNNATSLQKELHQSYFVPDQCDVPAMTSFEMCQTLSRFQHVVTI